MIVFVVMFVAVGMAEVVLLNVIIIFCCGVCYGYVVVYVMEVVLVLVVMAVVVLVIFV